MKRKVLIDPLVNIMYASFYIEGLYEKYGKNNVNFDGKPFKHLSLASRMSFLPFIILGSEGYIKKFVISFNDSYVINKELYEWCDVYGSVNANFELTPIEFHDKLVSLVPSFGIKIWHGKQTLWYATQNLLKAFCSTSKKFSERKFLGKYNRMTTLRVPLSEYDTERNKMKKDIENYVFHLSTLWYNDEWNKNDEGVNKTRANFIRACKQVINLEFEGGMVSQGNERSSEEKFRDCLYPYNIEMKIWMEKTKKSLIVFNTPAFWNCHGWKLGEYLALGKAIISTSLFNDLPAPLVHGENIHFVENNERKIKEAIELIINDEAYRVKLEEGAKKYWKEYGCPMQTLDLIIKD